MVIFPSDQHRKAKIYRKPQHGTDRWAAKLQRVVKKKKKKKGKAIPVTGHGGP
jgi:G:T-mismatch repair DNA endonuclease (very short patch repair protein)